MTAAQTSPAPPSEGVAPLVRVRDLHKTYTLGRVPVPVLRGVSLDVGRAEFVAVLGASGSGKSTLLHLIGGLDRADSEKEWERCRACGRAFDDERAGSCPGCGARRPPRSRARIEFDGRDIAVLRQRALDRYRNADVGFVFQFYHLLPELTVVENVVVGAMIGLGRLGYMRRGGEARARAAQLLDAMGLSHRLRHRPAELSGGERQRVAIARALINGPSLLLADEPTGNLDHATGEKILDAIERLRDQSGLTLVVATHDPATAARADRVIRLQDGVIEG